MNALVQIVWVIGALVLALLLIGGAAVALRSRTDANGVWPFYAKRLLSEPEQVLYFRLVEAMPGHIVLAQVQLSRILGVKRGQNSRAWLNRINRMSADFVVCRKDASVMAVIELDDKSHTSVRRQRADAKKDHALSSANLRTIRWQARDLPNVREIQEQLLPNSCWASTQSG